MAYEEAAAGDLSGVSPLFRLSPAVRQWVNDQHWVRLRPIQERALDPVLAADRDVIISAATASGKTEAAFLPALSHVRPDSSGTTILYISPLKALIGDQYRRLGHLAKYVGVSITPWHSDVSWNSRQTYTNNPNGILLTTPESLESFLLRHCGWCYEAFADLEYVIIDEFHSLVNTERGMQLLSLLRRLESMVRRKVPRIALSATMGSPEEMVDLLRPHRDSYPCEVVSDDSETRIRIEVRAYADVPPYMRRYVPDNGLEQMTHDLYGLLHEGHHLVFVNSRRRAEQIATALGEICRQEGSPNRFFPHHGSLSRELRSSLEARLQGSEPATAVCTMTLELGIDIGNMDSVVQLDAPGSVASMRQRLGRSGRRDSDPLLRLFQVEGRLHKRATLADRLRLGLFQGLAVLRLLSDNWFEPPAVARPQFSTLVQQVLSVVAQYDGVKPSQLWSLLCGTGPFQVSRDDFMTFLKGLSAREMVCRAENGEVKLMPRGWACVENNSFTTAFCQPQEYQLVNISNQSRLGRVPMEEPFEKGQRILFAGRAWSVQDIDEQRKQVNLAPDSHGQAPRFGGMGQAVHDHVRETMYEIYCGAHVPGFFSYNAKQMVREGRSAFSEHGLDRSRILVGRSGIYVLPWKGDRFCRTLSALFRLAGLDASDAAGIVDIHDANLSGFTRAVQDLLGKGRPEAAQLTANLQESLQEKFSFWVDKSLRDKDNLLRFYELDEAWTWLEKLAADGLVSQLNFI
ncbi:MAG: DEAD/DEAH box helicase [Desulfovibrionaceae bacterium]|nr:DEAD/DEAH box helicase [Desulfovibrionaceae bacterium]